MGIPAFQQYPTPLGTNDFDNTWRFLLHNAAGTGEGAVPMETLNQMLLKMLLNTQTGVSYTLVLLDAGKVVEMNNAAANTVNIPLNASVAFPVGTQITIVQIGAGQTTIDAATGVTLNGVDGATRSTIAQYESITIYQRATNTWVALNV